MLMHHTNARSNSVTRAFKCHGLTVDDDLSLVRLVHPVQDVHQRGLSRAVFSEQGMDVPLLDRQIDRVVSSERAKPFRDPPQL